MKRLISSAFLAACAFAVAPSAFAASDYLLQLDDIDSVTKGGTIEVMSWSFGATNSSSASSGSMGAGRVVAPRDVATGQSSGKRQHQPVRVQASQNSQSLRESPSRASTGGVSVAAGDVDGDGRADLSVAAAADELQNFTITLDGASPQAAALCATGKHFPKATLTARGEVYSLDHAVVASCSSTPARISTNLSVAKQTQGATFGERCNAGQCPASSITLTLTGQMKHTKTGHVTLMK